MASRIIHAFASGVCEALPVQLVNDIFFRMSNILLEIDHADKCKSMSAAANSDTTRCAFAGARQVLSTRVTCLLADTAGDCTSTWK